MMGLPVAWAGQAGACLREATDLPALRPCLATSFVLCQGGSDPLVLGLGPRDLPLAETQRLGSGLDHDSDEGGVAGVGAGGRATLQGG